MKIAIQGHPTRGKEVIQILESLGGKNNALFIGVMNFWYYIDSDGHIRNDYEFVLTRAGFKTYTLEEFEKEFPFKPGDTVIDKDGDEGCIAHLCNINGCVYYSVKYNYNQFTVQLPKSLKLKKKEMNTRNITLTLDKAKEWYKKGGELKEIALQAFTEKELNPLPRSWEEFCKNYPIKPEEICINVYSKFIFSNVGDRNSTHDKNIYPSRKSAEAHLAMIQLEQLRDCWRQGWKPTPEKAVYAIKVCNGKLDVFHYFTREFLSFPTREMAEEFLKCFRDLIEKAGDLI